MKTRKTKLALTGLISAMSLAFIGSIGGTFAWYQYSTLATAAYSGTSAKCTENLQVAVGDSNNLTFHSDLKIKDIADYLKSQRADSDADTVNYLKPVSAGNQAKDAALATLKSNPVYQEAKFDQWENAVNTDYVTFPLTFRVVDVDGKKDGVTLLNQDTKLALSDITIEGKNTEGNNTEDKVDISDSIRVQFSSTGEKAEGSENRTAVNRLVGKVASTTTHGPLDLNGDNENDKSNKYEWETGVELDYGAIDNVENPTETCYLPEDRKTKDTAGAYTNYIGIIPAGQTLRVNVTIFREGWQILNGSETAIWDASKVIQANYRVGRTFEIPKLAKHNSTK